MLHSHILIKDEIKGLREANKKQVKKRPRSRRQIAQEGSLTKVLRTINSADGVKGDAGEYIFDSVAAPEPTVEPLIPVLPTIRRK